VITPQSERVLRRERIFSRGAGTIARYKLLELLRRRARSQALSEK